MPRSIPEPTSHAPVAPPYGLLLQCEEATVNIRSGEVYVYPSSVIMPDSAERALGQGLG